MNITFFYQLKGLLFIVIGLCGIGVLIGIHEFGHYFFARLFGVRAPSFSIGFGPKLFSKKIAGTEFKISAIPLGGYVEIAGMAEIGQGEQKEAYATDSGSFKTKGYWQKAFILMGGIIFNIILAFLFFVGLYFTGMPKSLLFSPGETKPVVKQVRPESLAAQAKFTSGDIITTINKTPTPSILNVITELQKNKNKEITITFKRGSNEMTMQLKLDQTGRLGIEFKTDYFSPESFIMSIKKAGITTWDIMKRTTEVFVALFKKRSVENIGGPLLLISTLISNAKQGISIFIFLLAFISINLAILNLIPLPITDGGQLVLATIEAIIRRPLPEKAIEIIHQISWLLIMAFLAYLIFKDSKMLFWDKIKHLLGK